MRYSSSLFLVSLLCACMPPIAPESGDAQAHAVMITDSLGIPVCSGVAIGMNTALTAAHCMSRAASAEGQHIDAAIYPWPGRDIALISVAAPFHARPAFMRKDRPERVHIVGWGCSGMRELATRELRMSSYWPDADYLEGRICHGDSGAGVFDDRGALVAIGVAFVVEPSHLGALVAWLD